MQLMRDVGMGEMADNVKKYLDDGLIKIDPKLGKDGLTTRNPVGSETITLDDDLFMAYGGGGPSWVDFSVVLNVASTLVHEKHHAEKQSLGENIILYIGEGIADIFTLGGAEDVVEWGAYNEEFAFLIKVELKLLNEWDTLVQDWNQEMRDYSRKVEQYNSMEHPTKELVNEMLREIDELLKKADKMQEVLDKLTQVYNQYGSLAEGYKNAVGSKKSAEKIEKIAKEGHEKTNARKQELAENREKLESHKKLLEELDPPLESPSFFEPDDRSTAKDAEVVLASDNAEVDGSLAKLRSAKGSEKFGAAKEYFDELAKKIGNGKTNLHFTMMEHNDVEHASAVPIGMWVKNGVVSEVDETPNKAPKYTVHIPEKSVIAAFTSGNVASALDEQIRNGEVKIESKGAKIRLQEAGTMIFQVEAEDMIFDVALTGEGIASLVFSKEDRLIVLENDGSDGIIEIEIPKELLDGELMVIADDKQVEFDVSESETHSTLLINKPADSGTISIHGTTVIPEFPVAMLVLTAFVAFVLLFTLTNIRTKLISRSI